MMKSSVQIALGDRALRSSLTSTSGRLRAAALGPVEVAIERLYRGVAGILLKELLGTAKNPGRIGSCR